MPNVEEYLKNAAAAFVTGEVEKGKAPETMKRASTIASLILGKNLSAYDVAIVMMAVRMAFLNHDPKRVKSYTDLINFTAIAGALSSDIEPPGEKAPAGR
jgi:hypothetical protein